MESYQTYLGLGIALCVIFGFSLVRRHRSQRFKKLFDAAQSAYRRHDYEAAERELRQCIRIAPIWSEGHTALGETLARQGKLDEAEVSIRLASDLRPRDPLGHLDMGFFLVTYRPKDVDRALASFEKALSLDPSLREGLMADRRLTHLRDEPAFRALLD